ncbi:MAG: phytoene desaturase family protein [Acidimicrobiia bacterium]
MERFDFVIVGSGINSLVCASMLARAGNSVVVLERNERLGGCVRAEELFPGYIHEVLSSWYPLFVTSPAYAALGEDLLTRGVEFVKTDKPTAVITEDGSTLVFTMDDEENNRRLDELAAGEGERYGAAVGGFFAENSDIAFALLGNEVWGRKTARALYKDWRKRGLLGTFTFFGESLETCRTWLERDFRSELTRALIAPWVLHAGLGPDDAYSGMMGKLIIGTVTLAGMPLVEGGSARLIDAFRQLIEDNGGKTVTNADVDVVIIENGRANGVATATGDAYGAEAAVICNVTPTQLYGRLLRDASVPSDVKSRADSYRYGRSDMQIHFALNQAPEWEHPELEDVAMVHLTPGLDGVSGAVNEAERGLLPHAPTIVVGQPTSADPSRAPEDGSILWIQLQELPARIKGDARGEIPVPPDGSWTEEVRERYADRIQARLGVHIKNLDSALVGRRAFSPADLENINMNLIGGDPYSGACTIDQFLVWRPMPGSKNHETAVKDLYHIGASTHPGPGLGGGSGFMVASRFV